MRFGKIIIDGMDPITNFNTLQSFSIDSGCYVDGNIIGSLYVNCLKANFIKNIEDVSNKILQAQVEIKYNNKVEYLPMGKYIIERLNNEITAKNSQLTAYDFLY